MDAGTAHDLLAISHTAVFWLFALLTVGSAFGVALARSLVYSAFSLLGTFFGVAGLYVFLGADFLAAAQLLIYIGGILILLLFGVMLTRRSSDIPAEVSYVQFGPGLLLSGAVFGTLLYVALSTSWHSPEAEYAMVPTTQAIGHRILGEQLLPFEAASVLLLVALVGAATLVRRQRQTGPRTGEEV